MRLLTLLATTVGMAALMIGGVPSAWAGAGAGGAASCLGTKGQGATALRGTVSMDVTDGVGDGVDGNETADVLFRLERSGKQHFFRLHVTTHLEGGLDTASLQRNLCRCINPNDPDLTTQAARDAVSTLVQQIRDAFGLSATRVLMITDSSITDSEPAGSDTVFPGTTTHAGSLTDAVIYAQ